MGEGTTALFHLSYVLSCLPLLRKKVVDFVVVVVVVVVAIVIDFFS